MKRKLLLDASVYIQAIRDQRYELLAARVVGGDVIYLSAVVAAELMRGATDARSLRELDKQWRDFRKVGRLITPQAGDWYEAGVVLRRIAANYGYESIGQARLLPDLLIALSARRMGITVVTLNVADFERIAEFRRFAVVSALDLAT
jgi:predicted nucleic acid-binding protein